MYHGVLMRIGTFFPLHYYEMNHVCNDEDGHNPPFTLYVYIDEDRYNILFTLSCMNYVCIDEDKHNPLFTLFECIDEDRHTFPYTQTYYELHV